MNNLSLGSIGLSLNTASDQSHLRKAAEAEQLGYSAIWLHGGQIDSLDRITEIVQATRTIPVVPAIISPDVYGPEAVIELYSNLEAAAPGRFVAGLGGSQKPRSLAALNRYLDVLDHANQPVPAARRLLAALGPRKLQLARDRCSGAITLLVSPDYTRVARRALGDHVTLVVEQLLVLEIESRLARETARGTVRFLAGVSGYRANFKRMGFSEADISNVSDQLIDDLVAWGDSDSITARIREQFAAGADHVVLTALHNKSQPGPIEVARQLAVELIV